MVNLHNLDLRLVYRKIIIKEWGHEEKTMTTERTVISLSDKFTLQNSHMHGPLSPLFSILSSSRKGTVTIFNF